MTELPWAIDAIRALGIAGGPVFAVLWWLERQERKTCQKEARDLLAQVLTITHQAATSISASNIALNHLGEGMDEGIASLAKLMRSIANRVR